MKKWLSEGKKMKKIYMALTIFVASILVSAPNIYASEYLGNFCWNYYKDKSYQGYFQLGITHIGNNHFDINGYKKSPDTVLGVLNGNGEIYNDNFIMTLNFTDTDFDKNIWGAIWRVIINLKTLEGTLYGFDFGVTDMNKSPQKIEKIDYFIRTLKPVTCP